MFNKIIIAALAFAITANGIQITNETSMTLDDKTCSDYGAFCDVDSDCCSGICDPGDPFGEGMD